MMDAGTPASWFQRRLLPGLAFKAVVIGGGYATGRELIEFFLSVGPWGGLLGMLLAMILWSIVCMVAFALSQQLAAYEYRSLFKSLLGPAWPVFEIVYILFLVLILAVMSAAAGEIGQALFAWPLLVGSIALVGLIALVTSFGSNAAERMFRITSFLLYAVYAVFLILALASFGDRIPAQISAAPLMDGWIFNGLTYASYNVVAAIAVLPFIRHLTNRRDAVIAGALAGPLTMAPALIFFLCMVAFYPAISDEALPSDFLLRQLDAPWFAFFFQLMIFIALLETGVGAVNVVHERIGGALAARNDRQYPPLFRFVVGAILLTGSGFLAARFGLISLIAEGYGAFGYIMFAIFVIPLLTVGIWRLRRGNVLSSPSTQEPSHV